MSNELHRQRMRDLIDFAATSFTKPIPSPFASSIYHSDGELIAQEHNSVIEENDPTRHGEMNAIRTAARIVASRSVEEKLNSRTFAGYTIYTTGEPCCMCMAACIWCGFDTVVFGMPTIGGYDEFWPQPLDVTSQELVERVKCSKPCEVIGPVELGHAQWLFNEWRSHMATRGLL